MDKLRRRFHQIREEERSRERQPFHLSLPVIIFIALVILALACYRLYPHEDAILVY